MQKSPRKEPNQLGFTIIYLHNGQGQEILNHRLDGDHR
jgi:hypothetical protein